MSANVGKQLLPTATSLYVLLGTGWDGEIKANDGTTIAQLMVLGPEVAMLADASSPLFETLSAWRNDNANCFLDTSRVTPQSTRRWLLTLTKSPDRLLFLAYNNECRPVAQYGLRRLSADVVELDNGILGVRNEFPDLFFRIQLRILDICKTRLGFLEVRARVLADNMPALFLHKRCGLGKVEILKDQTPDGRDVIVLGAVLQDINSN